jgi:hypothetical protein
MSQLPSTTAANRTTEPPDSRPGAFEMLFHPGRSFRFVTSLLGDRRVSLLRKLLFLLPIVILILALLAPETIIGLIVGAVLPVAGEVLSLPLDISLDWITLAIIGFALLRIFPAPIVGEHHQRHFHKPKNERRTA